MLLLLEAIAKVEQMQAGQVMLNLQCFHALHLREIREVLGSGLWVSACFTFL
jgi:hypothetical protein